MSAMNLIERKCPVCGVVYGLDPDFDAYRKRGGLGDDNRKAGWYCPNGHYLVIRQSEADTLRLERDRLKQRLAAKGR